MTTALAPAEAFHPGEYLRDELEERGWTEKEFAEILARPVQAVSEILNGRKQIVADTALALAEALGTSPDLWLNLQTAYNLYEARTRRPVSADVARRARLRALVPVSELRRRRWIPDTDDLDALEAGVKNLLGLREINDEPVFAAAARRSNVHQDFSPAQLAWLGRVRQRATERSVSTYDPQALEDLALDLVHRIHDPTDLAALPGWLADCGVVLVAELALRSSKLDGAAMLLPNGVPAIGLTTRGDRMDSFVFTLLHECAHLVLGHVTAVGICVDEDLDEFDGGAFFEVAANEQAGEWVLPSDVELPNGPITLPMVISLATRYRLHASFVIGRLQRQRRDWGLLRRNIPRVRPFLGVA
jgi:HTH-type transcriptional regulator/antitoxin HigA